MDSSLLVCGSFHPHWQCVLLWIILCWLNSLNVHLTVGDEVKDVKIKDWMTDSIRSADFPPSEQKLNISP